jgi:hypothetical protein
VVVTLIDNPMIGWIWGGGAVATVAAIVAIWPGSRRVAIADMACDRDDTNLAIEQSDSRANAA